MPHQLYRKSPADNHNLPFSAHLDIITSRILSGIDVDIIDYCISNHMSACEYAEIARIVEAIKKPQHRTGSVEALRNG
jgi:hypothetical protein